MDLCLDCLWCSTLFICSIWTYPKVHLRFASFFFFASRATIQPLSIFFFIAAKAQQVLIVGAFIIAVTLTVIFVCLDFLHHCFQMLSNIIAGFLLGALVVYFIDDYFYDFKSYGWMYETVFLASILAVMIVVTPFETFGPIVLSATCGSFYVVQGICYVYGNHLNYVILNALRYTSVDGYRLVHSTPATNLEGMTFHISPTGQAILPPHP